MGSHEISFHLSLEFLQGEVGMGWIRKRGIDEEEKVQIKGKIEEGLSLAMNQPGRDGGSNFEIVSSLMETGEPICTRALKSLRLASLPGSFSGCHWMPMTFGYPGSSIPSTRPSGDLALILRPFPKSLTPW
jgi:hypothetical protein